eukprot:GHVS01104169.1.p1 GENE.GHVS01104169.1~~GHVS01104169.1.p1  ORF type:complete len:111 (-),score=0.40 GHVS01104169.1:20-352(-)
MTLRKTMEVSILPIGCIWVLNLRFVARIRLLLHKHVDCACIFESSSIPYLCQMLSLDAASVGARTMQQCFGRVACSLAASSVCATFHIPSLGGKRHSRSSHLPWLLAMRV